MVCVSITGRPVPPGAQLKTPALLVRTPFALVTNAVVSGPDWYGIAPKAPPARLVAWATALVIWEPEMDLLVRVSVVFLPTKVSPATLAGSVKNVVPAIAVG